MSKYKAFILASSDTPRNGYINIVEKIEEWDESVTSTLHGDTKVIPGTYKDLSQFFEAGQLSEVIFGPYFNIINPQEMVDVVKNIHNKLCNNGRFVVSFVDIDRVGKGINSGISLEEIHALTLGRANEYKSVLQTTVVKDVLEKLGFYIETISSQDYFTTLECVKNEIA